MTSFFKLKHLLSLYKLVGLFALLFSCFNISAQDTSEEMAEYSYTELFQMIENETDSVFTLKNAYIVADTITDKQYIQNQNEVWDIAFSRKYGNDSIGINRVIDKHLKLENVCFEKAISVSSKTREILGCISNIKFEKSLTLTNVHGISLKKCQFEEKVNFYFNKNYSRGDYIKSLFIVNCLFNNTFYLVSRSEDDNLFLEEQAIILGNTFNLINGAFCSVNLINEIVYNLTFWDNIINGDGLASIYAIEPKDIDIKKNQFNSLSTNIKIELVDDSPKAFIISENTFSHYVNIDFPVLMPSLEIEWNQFNNKLISEKGRMHMAIKNRENKKKGGNRYIDQFSEEFQNEYFNKFRVENTSAYNAEMTLKGSFYNYYKDKFIKESANEVYIEIKDLETKRLEYLYNESKSFNRYFKWKINQFLKLFSDYGTNPAKSIIFSIYVILIFGSIYLFFPNSWDIHGRNRLIHRYAFFMNYMTKDEGIHEVYINEKVEETSHLKEFEKNIENTKQIVPTFFTITAKLLHKWAISGSKISSFLLKRIDVMKGKWSSLSKGKRIWKATLLIFIFIIAIGYDIFIKILNALMLSINTFTTLGFGEIPIKGLPRYLAIIQGFVGWFLLTIFSVSLISQLME